MQGIDPEDLVKLLNSMEVAASLAEAIGDPGLQEARGWDLTGWACESSSRAIRFIRRDEKGQTVAVITAVNAPKEQRFMFTPTPAPWKQKVLMLGS